MRRAIVLLLLTVCASNACASRGARPSAPVPSAVPAPDLAGRWDFSVDLGTRTTPGVLWLFLRGGEYTGTLSPQGTNALPVRSLVLRRDQVAMTVDTPEGPVTFDGTIGESGAAMQGIVTYHQGVRYPLTARRRPSGGS
ncbi:MAG: hypothetical protein H7066_21515 [Cytophagaceae bacterium]|nr:hypothetical protein [Gemmatimonadaceae bacterium]